MKDNVPLYSVLAAVLIVSVVSVVSLDSSTGGAMLESNACMCYIDYANPSQWDTPRLGSGINYDQANVPAQIIKVKSRQVTDEMCQNQCEIHFHRKMNVRGKAVGPGTDTPEYSTVIPRVGRYFV